jgi:hypothetical protein
MLLILGLIPVSENADKIKKNSLTGVKNGNPT